MKTFLSIVLLAGMMFGFCNAAMAETGDTATVEIWKCKLKEGKTMDDVASANGTWVTYMNANVEGGGISSYGQTTMVGNHEKFMYIDVFPDMKAWIAAKEAISSEEGKALETELQKVATCTSNSLFSSTQH